MQEKTSEFLAGGSDHWVMRVVFLRMGTRVGRAGSLDFRPELGARVVGIEPSQFAEEFLGFLVTRHRDGDLDLHDFVPALVLTGRRGNSLLPQTELLAARSEERRVGKECRVKWE